MQVPDRTRCHLGRAGLAAAAAGLAVIIVAGCGSSGPATSASVQQGRAAPAATSAGTGSMSGMNMSGTKGAASSGMAAGGIKPVPMQVLGTATWQGMKITAKAMTAVPFLIYNGTSMREVKPAKNASFHLMVFLSDAQTGVVIPYASVWATITEGAKTRFDGSLWPMISRYMGPHYGDDVSLPGAGTYKLALLVSPPVSARHMEYQDVWLKPHKASFTFHWKPAS